MNLETKFNLCLFDKILWLKIDRICTVYLMLDPQLWRIGIGIRNCASDHTLLAAESTDTANTSDGDSDDIVDILAASDDLAKVIERYRTVVVDGKPDTAKTSHQTPSSGTKNTLAKQNSELLLELDLNAPPGLLTTSLPA